MRIAICGSMQFEDEMHRSAQVLRQLGYEVEQPVSGETRNFDGSTLQKKGFIDEHFAKIDRSDAILVTNLEKKGIKGYIGGNTLMEMTYAYSQGLDVFLLHPAPTDVSYADEINAMLPVCLDGEVEGVKEYFDALPKVFLSSSSPVKQLAVSRAFRRAGKPVLPVPVPTRSGVNEQPVSFDETYQGAMNRHMELERLAEPATGDYLVTIESGIHTILKERNYFGCSAVVLQPAGEKKYAGIDVDIEFPKHLTDRIPKEYDDLGELVRAEYGAIEKDPFPYFTNHKLTRAKILENALFNIIVQLEASQE